MVKIKGAERPVAGDISPLVSQKSEPLKEAKSTKPVSPDQMAQGVLSEAKREEMRREWKRLRDLPHKHILSGAANLFEGVYFPPNLLDPKSRENDPKYMRLLAAILGLDDLNDYFYTHLDEEDDEEAEEDEVKVAKGEVKPKRRASLKPRRSS